MKTSIYLIILFAIFSGTVYSQFKQTPLPYSYNALEPYIDSTTMYIHFNNHHASYLSKFNTALEAYPELYKKSVLEILGNLDKLPNEIITTVINAGGGFYNHSFFWTIMTPASKSKISSKLEKQLVNNFGSIENFRNEFENAAATKFGSGWAWLIKLPDGKLKIITTSNQDSPIMSNAEIKGKPLLALDVWEHAYYLKYQSKRASYVKSFWNIINWGEVEKLLNE